ncbi:Histone_acetyltransferase GCN5 [Hexamita inflata]|uniref:Histone acetyltransferase GCN5 n=1 Tax=Hexamita inflata TaxID=28002 RepID=A0AA86UTI2_9EUKA|nr:Histone acetyltransferase GCN5 [Hexamita inflata]
MYQLSEIYNQHSKTTEPTKRKHEIIGFRLDEPGFNPYEPKMLLKLLMAKDLFQAELPRMPKDYITRLVFNPHHETIMLFEYPQPPKVSPLVGGICFRKFPEVKLIEIAFCAVSGAKKYVGHGAYLMNHLKEYIKAQGYADICTYADNSAIEYFQKQGFSMKVAIPEETWLGRVKHYEGAKFMHCPLYNGVNYITLNQQIRQQRELLLKYVGIEPQLPQDSLDKVTSLAFAQKFSNSKIKLSPPEEIARCCKAAEAAAYVEAGKEYAMSFLNPMPVAEYCSVVGNDLQLIVQKSKEGFYRTKYIFREHVKSILERCESYNGEKAEISLKAKQLVDGLIANFEKYYEKNCGVDGVEDVE